MKDHDKTKKLSCLKYWDVNDLYGQAVSQKCLEMTLNGVEIFLNLSDESDERYFLEGDVQYPESLHNFHNDLPFLSERMKIKKVEKLLANLQDREEYIIHIRNSKQALNHGLVLEKCIES